MKKKLGGKTTMVLAILTTLLVTCCATVLFLNLRAGEKQIRYQLEHRFSVKVST